LLVEWPSITSDAATPSTRPQARLFLTNRRVGVLHREGGLARVDVASSARLVGAAPGKAKAMSVVLPLPPVDASFMRSARLLNKRDTAEKMPALSSLVLRCHAWRLLAETVLVCSEPPFRNPAPSSLSGPLPIHPPAALLPLQLSPSPITSLRRRETAPSFPISFVYSFCKIKPCFQIVLSSCATGRRFSKTPV
jgi:hypothetical protein